MGCPSGALDWRATGDWLVTAIRLLRQHQTLTETVIAHLRTELPRGEPWLKRADRLLPMALAANEANNRVNHELLGALLSAYACGGAAVDNGSSL